MPGDETKPSGYRLGNRRTRRWWPIRPWGYPLLGHHTAARATGQGSSAGRSPVGQVDGARWPFTLRRTCGGNEARRRPRGSYVVVLLHPTARRHDPQVIGSDAARVGGRGRRNRAELCSAVGAVVWQQADESAAAPAGPVLSARIGALSAPLFVVIDHRRRGFFQLREQSFLRYGRWARRCRWRSGSPATRFRPAGARRWSPAGLPCRLFQLAFQRLPAGLQQLLRFMRTATCASSRRYDTTGLLRLSPLPPAAKGAVG